MRSFIRSAVMIEFVMRKGDGMEMAKRAVKVLSIGLLLLMVVIMLLGMGYQDNSHKTKYTALHTVRSGETLWGIGEKYITPDRYMPEFIEGIYQLNYDKIFAQREQKGANKYDVYPGDELEIVYWR